MVPPRKFPYILNDRQLLGFRLLYNIIIYLQNKAEMLYTPAINKTKCVQINAYATENENVNYVSVYRIL